MKRNFLKFLGAVLLTLPLAFATTACSDPDEPANEKENKLHEDPSKAVITLTKGRMADFDPAAGTFSPEGEFVSLGETQTYAMVLHPEKGWQLENGSVEGFYVEDVTENPDVVYSLDIQYFNAQGKSINHEFMEEGQDAIHQHFFSYYENRVRVRKPENLPYVYHYADRDKGGKFIAEKNPLGFHGYIQFKDKFHFELSIDLMHAAKSKYNNDGSVSPYYSPSPEQVGTALWDINIKIPVYIKKLSHFADVASAELIFIEGHLHGHPKFHENLYSKEVKYIGRRDTLRYTLTNGKWMADAANSQRVVCESNHPHYALLVNYYDKDHNLINHLFADQQNASLHRHFFYVTDVAPTFDGEAESDDKNGQGFFDYHYVDTDPWNQTIKFDGAKWIGETNPVGFKGYFGFKKARKQFTMNVRLLYSKTKEVLGKGGSLPWHHIPAISVMADTEALPIIPVPMIVYMDSNERSLEVELDTAESDLSPEGLRTIRSLQRAYGIGFEEAVSELYWNFNGVRPPHSKKGFWF